MKNNNTAEFSKVRISRNCLVSSSSGVISFRRDFSFKAGQVVGITTSMEIPPRLYSIASAEQNEMVDILYKVIPGGELTPDLIELKAGDTLFVSSPFGKFTARNQPAWYLATGTGLAPFLSMIRSNYTDCIKLLHGSRSVKDFYEAEYLRKILKDNYIQCYTGSEKFSGYKGRITKYIQESQDLNPSYKYYLCGSAEMVVEVREILLIKNIQFQNIFAEIYF